MELRKKEKENKKIQFKINNSIKQALWESIPCICEKNNVMKSHPMQSCEACRCKICWDSVPQKSFIVKDEKGKDKIINEIKLVRGKNEDVIGWEF
tara:strand:- start:1616 stop:1900 length:285 start_codon:yes stop_codon:yes gene_type:complete